MSPWRNNHVMQLIQTNVGVLILVPLNLAFAKSVTLINTYRRCRVSRTAEVFWITSNKRSTLPSKIRLLSGKP